MKTPSESTHSEHTNLTKEQKIEKLSSLSLQEYKKLPTKDKIALGFRKSGNR